MTKLCSVPGCGRKHAARGWCNSHYVRYKRGGADMQRPIDGHIVNRPYRGAAPYPCKVDGCDNPAVSQRYCLTHITRLRAGKSMQARKYMSREGGCKVAGCGRPIASKGMCAAHISRRRQGYYGKIEDPVGPRGGITSRRDLVRWDVETLVEAPGGWRVWAVLPGDRHLMRSAADRRMTSRIKLCGKENVRLVQTTTTREVVT